MPWLRHLVLFRPAAAGAFVSAPDAGSQARVGAFELVAATLVGPASATPCRLHEGAAAYGENGSSYRFAARGGGVLEGASFAQKTFGLLFQQRRLVCGAQRR
jgi:hypothetical protein